MRKTTYIEYYKGGREVTTIISPKLEKLKNQLKNGNESSLYFLDEIKSNHTPLVEQCPIDNQYKLITYIWLGDQNTENVYVVGSFPGWDLSVKSITTIVYRQIFGMLRLGRIKGSFQLIILQ